MPIAGLYVVGWILRLYELVLLIRVVLSWLRLPPYHPVMRRVAPAIYAVTEPLLAPIRKWLAPYQRNSPFDFSVLILYFAIEIVRRLLPRLMFG